MIEYRNGDLLKQKDIDIIIHQCNCFNTMGSGIAKAISNMYPEVIEADNRTKKGDKSKLGSFTSAVTKDNLHIINMYSQYRYGRGQCHTDYYAMKKALLAIQDDYESNVCINVMGLPYNMGCDRGGGDWDKVMEILQELFGEHNTKTKLVICKLN